MNDYFHPTEFGLRLLENLKIQIIQWTIIPEKARLVLEIIAPFKAHMHVFKRDRYHETYYVRLVAIVRKKCKDPELNIDDVILLEVPVKTFEKSMWALPLSKKRILQQLQGNNIFMDFTKENAKRMTVKNIERLEIKPEHQEYIERHYKEEEY